MRGFSYNNGFKNNTHQKGGKQGVLKKKMDYGKSKALFSLAVNDNYSGFKFRSKPVYNEK